MKINHKFTSAMWIILLCLFTEPLFSTVNNEKYSIIVFGIIYFVLGTIFLINKKIRTKVIREVLDNKLIILGTLLILFSFTWSTQPLQTLEYSLAFLGTVLSGFIFSSSFPKEKQKNILIISLLIMVLLSLILVFILPSRGLSTEFPGAWQGIYSHKNFLGRVAGLAIIALWSLDHKSLVKRIFKISSITLSIILLVFSQSVTPLIGVIGTAFLGFVLYEKDKSSNNTKIALLFSIIFIGIVSALLINANLGSVTGIFGKDSTLTSRTLIWKLSIEKIAIHPILGYGYSIFWKDLNGEAGDIFRYLEWAPPHAHNGYLDLLLSVGLLGAIIGIFLIFYAVKNILRWKGTNYYKSVMIYLLIINFAESVMLKYNSIFLLITVVAYLELSHKNA